MHLLSLTFCLIRAMHRLCVAAGGRGHQPHSARAMPSGMTAPGGGLCSQKQTLEPPDIPPSSQELAWQLLKQNFQARCA